MAVGVQQRVNILTSDSGPRIVLISYDPTSDCSQMSLNKNKKKCQNGIKVNVIFCNRIKMTELFTDTRGLHVYVHRHVTAGSPC